MAIDEVQNDRLLGVEDALREISYKTGHIEAQHVAIMDKLDQGFAELKANHEAIVVAHSNVDSRLKVVESKEEARTRRIQLLKKAAIPLLTATAGVFGAKFGSELLNALTHFFSR